MCISGKGILTAATLIHLRNFDFDIRRPRPMFTSLAEKIWRVKENVSEISMVSSMIVTAWKTGPRNGLLEFILICQVVLLTTFFLSFLVFFHTCHVASSKLSAVCCNLKHTEATNLRIGTPRQFKHYLIDQIG